MNKLDLTDNEKNCFIAGYFRGLVMGYEEQGLTDAQSKKLNEIYGICHGILAEKMGVFDIQHSFIGLIEEFNNEFEENLVVYNKELKKAVKGYE